ncbi:hypothetical protein K4K57_003322 [Colletotrichum sp. SAR 10_99]|nr:hypothetical protein K4K57_003322 [Colletotrichum sp. SAR 10_99]
MDEVTREVRYRIFEYYLANCRPPTTQDIAESIGISEEQARISFQQLDAAHHSHALCCGPHGSSSSSVSLSSKSGTVDGEMNFTVTNDGIQLHGNEVDTEKCVVHFSAPLKTWWTDVRFACGTIHVFGSQTQAAEWCERYGFRYGEVMNLDTMWKLSKDLFNHVEMLTRRLAEAEQSLEEKNIYIKSVKQSGAEMKLQINQLQSEKDKYSFSSVVIDGDCMPFTDQLVTQGFEGGKKAAGMLRQTILEQLPELDPDMPHHSQVMIRVYANLKGLAKVYRDTQILKNVETLNDFVRGFNRGSYLCDFVDAGNGKECADEKVKENFELGLNDVHCRRVLLGGSGDNGFRSINLGNHSD